MVTTLIADPFGAERFVEPHMTTVEGFGWGLLSMKKEQWMNASNLHSTEAASLLFLLEIFIG